MSSLLKYKKHFKLNIRPNAPKIELIQNVKKHFARHPRLRDVDVIASFLFANVAHKERVKNIQTNAPNTNATTAATTSSSSAAQ